MREYHRLRFELRKTLAITGKWRCPTTSNRLVARLSRPLLHFAISTTKLRSRLVDILPAGEPPVSRKRAFSVFRQATVLAMAAVPLIVRSTSDGKACLRRSVEMAAHDRVAAANEELPGLDGWLSPTSPTEDTTTADTHSGSCRCPGGSRRPLRSRRQHKAMGRNADGVERGSTPQASINAMDSEALTKPGRARSPASFSGVFRTRAGTNPALLRLSESCVAQRVAWTAVRRL